MDADKEKSYKNVLCGDFTSPLPPVSSKVVRIFISSTFTDMSAERNALLKSVYPKLKSYCRDKHGLEFQAVDMRWGVRDESSDDHSTTALCLEEIKQCQRLSVGPNFIALIGQRYGSVMVPSTISAEEYETISRYSPDAGLLQEWYLLDENSIEGRYILQPKSKHPDVDWSVVENKLLHLIQDAADKAAAAGELTRQEASKFSCSVTEEEIQHGLLDVASPEDHCLCFIRTIVDINLQHTNAWRFIDMAGDTVNTAAQKRLNDLKDSALPSKLTPANLFRYTVQWDEDDEGVSEGAHAEYLSKFCEDFETSVIELIDRSAAKLKVSTDETYIEGLEHAQTCVSKCDQFLGREQILCELECYVVGSSRKPFVIHGKSGCGKTSVMAKASSLISTWLGDVARKPINIIRFLGTTPASCTITSVLSSICAQIIKAAGLPEHLLSIPAEFEKLKVFFRDLLNMIAKENVTLVVFLDSVDQLVQSTDATQMKWLPTDFPGNVKVIISTIHEGYAIVDNVTDQGLPPSQLLEIPPLEHEDSVSILRYWLDQHNRKLTEEQWEAVESALADKNADDLSYNRQFDLLDREPPEKGCRPLYVKLIFDVIVQWRSYSENQPLQPTIKGIIKQLFKGLEKKHGQVLVSHALKYLVESKHGLSESELEDVLSLNEEVLTDIFQYHVPPVRRLPSILWKRIRSDIKEYLVNRVADGTSIMAWYHRQFREVCIANYVPKNSYFDKSEEDNTLFEYFLGKWADVEKPFTYNGYQMRKLNLSDPESSALRFVPQQPAISYTEQNGVVGKLFNGRKLSELIHSILRKRSKDEQIDLCLDLIFSSFDTIYAMLKLGRIQELLSPLDTVRCRVEDGESEVENREFWLMTRCVIANVVFLNEHPEAAGPLLTSQLLPFYNLLPHCTKLIQDIDSSGLKHCALVTPHQQHEDAGGNALCNITGHLGPVNDFLVHGNVMCTVSEKIIGVIVEEKSELILDIKPTEVPSGECMTSLVAFTKKEKLDPFYRNAIIWRLQKHKPFVEDTTLFATLSRTPRILVIDPSERRVRTTIDCGVDQANPSPILGTRLISSVNQDILCVWYKSSGKNRGRSSEVLMYDPVSFSLLQRRDFPSEILDVIRGTDRAGVFLADCTIHWLRLPLTSGSDQGTKEKAAELNEESSFSIKLPTEGARLTGYSVEEVGKKAYRYTRNETVQLAVATDDGRVIYVALSQDNTIECHESFQTSTRKIHQVHLSALDSFRGHEALIVVCTDRNTLLLTREYRKTPKPANLKLMCSFKRRYDHAVCDIFDGIGGEQLVCCFTGGTMDVILTGDADDEDAKEEEPPTRVRKLPTIDIHKDSLVKSRISESLIFTCSKDGTAKVFNVQLMAGNARHVKTFDHTDEIPGYIDSRYCKAFCISEDHRHACVWDIVNGQLHLPLKHDDDPILAGLLSLDELNVVSVDSQGTLRMWEVPPGKTEDSVLPLFQSKIEHQGNKPWLFAHKDFMSVFTRQGKHYVLSLAPPQITERQFIAQSCAVKCPLEDVKLQDGKILVRGHKGSGLFVFAAASGEMMKAYDLNSVSGSSLISFGQKILSARFWGEGMALTMGDKLLYWNETSSSIVPLLKNVQLELVSGKTGSQLAVFERTTNRVMIFTSPKAPVVEIYVEGISPLLYVTSEARYLICVQDRKHVKLWRVRDRHLIADYAMEVKIKTIDVTVDESFLVLGTRDRRIYSYVIADPLEPSHQDRIKNLPSRNHPLVTGRLDILRDPRYKQVQKMTYILESSSYQGSDGEPRFSTDDEIGYSDSGSDEDSNVRMDKKLQEKKPEANQCVAPRLGHRQAVRQGIGRCSFELQSTTKERVSFIKNSSDGNGDKAEDNDLEGKKKPWINSSPTQGRQRQLDESLSGRYSRACRLM